MPYSGVPAQSAFRDYVRHMDNDDLAGRLYPYQAPWLGRRDGVPVDPTLYWPADPIGDVLAELWKLPPGPLRDVALDLMESETGRRYRPKPPGPTLELGDSLRQPRDGGPSLTLDSATAAMREIWTSHT